MSAPPPLPPALRRAISSDLTPVRPLRSPALRALPLLAWAGLALALVVALRGVRPDAPALGFLLGWGVVAVEIAAGTALVALALAEAVPGRGAGRGAGLLAVGASAALFAGLALLVRRASPGMEVADPLRDHGPACLGFQGIIGLVALALAARLILRAAPIRAVLAGLLAGGGAGLAAEGIYHLGCPITHLRHVLAWHGSAILLLALAGLALGFVVERRERLLMEKRLEGVAPEDGNGRPSGS